MNPKLNQNIFYLLFLVRWLSKISAWCYIIGFSVHSFLLVLFLLFLVLSVLESFEINAWLSLTHVNQLGIFAPLLGTNDNKDSIDHSRLETGWLVGCGDFAVYCAIMHSLSFVLLIHWLVHVLLCNKVFSFIYGVSVAYYSCLAMCRFQLAEDLLQASGCVWKERSAID